MRIIDERGCIFGKLNILDLLIITIVVLIGTVLIKYLFLGEAFDVQKAADIKFGATSKIATSPPLEVIYTTKYVDMLVEVPPWLEKHIQIGLTEIHENKTIALLINKTILKESEARGFDEPILKLLLTFELLFQIERGQYFYKNSQVKIGRGLTIMPNRIDVSGIIIDIK